MKKILTFLLVLFLLGGGVEAKAFGSKLSNVSENNEGTNENSIMNKEMETMNDLNPDYLMVFLHEDGSIALNFNIEDEKIFALGEEMNEIREEAYMNGYNWEAFLNYYLAVNAPEILEGMDTDPEAGCYVAYYADGEENEAKAKRFAEIIVSLVENKEEIFKILREHGDDIAWD